jgi:hypothetical protein
VRFSEAEPVDACAGAGTIGAAPGIAAAGASGATDEEGVAGTVAAGGRAVTPPGAAPATGGEVCAASSVKKEKASAKNAAETKQSRDMSKTAVGKGSSLAQRPAK